MQSRIDLARKSFRDKNKELNRMAHAPEIIRRSINHAEGHKTSFNLPEIILGGQDGLVNVLGVILGVAAATSDPRMVTVAGLAATFAESISMGAVAYTSRIAEADYYQSEYEREKWEIEHHPEGEKDEVRALYERYGFKGKDLENIVETVTKDNTKWLEIMMNQELKLEQVKRKDALPTAIIVCISAFVGSFIPLVPFFLLPVKTAIITALTISTVVLFIVGWYKARETIGRFMIKQGIEMAVIGMVSALVGYAIGAIFKV